ncbi:hypothetical protein FRC10_002246 [Ceratobasidium sp. 414]|nr:hypothetical protein FRC10_002246 [Ceratobasidium sp. 414]
MDFLAGFNAVPVAPASVPYTGFHVDGRGYYVYLRMPFGLTGAPTTFCEMLASAFHDIIGKEVEVWMDDVATACDEFGTGLLDLRTIFAKCRAHGLSLSPAKTVLFMTEARFAGARCSAEGVQPDLTKVKAILDWPEPKTALEVMSFLGCVGSFRSKIKDYARIAQPLSDLTRDIQVPQVGTQAGKQEYKRALRETRVVLDDRARCAFVTLKTVLTGDQVTRSPVYDGRPFVVTMDGSKFGFGTVLSQEWEVKGSNGVTRKVTYPIAFASKRTSRTEERYIPFLLEFAALKYALDEFDNIIHGQPIELETDCKVLADLLANNKLNSTHKRWWELVIARDIRAVRHKPGVENRVCDSLSRMYESRPEDDSAPGRDSTVDPGWESAKGLVNDVCHLINDEQISSLLERFADDPFFADILIHILFDTSSSDDTTSADEIRAAKRRAHRAEGFMVEEDAIIGTVSSFSRRTLRPRYERSGTPTAIFLAHLTARRYRGDHLLPTLQKLWAVTPIRADATDYTSPTVRPAGHGGFKTVLVLVDAYSRFAFTFPLRNPGTGKSTVDCLACVSDVLLTPRSFMADGGSHFDCDEVCAWADGRGVQVIKTAPYAPWTNGLAEGYIKLLIGQLKRLCAATVGESPEEDSDPATTPLAWPKHLATAVAQLNDRVLPSLNYTPRELMTGQLTADRKAQLRLPLNPATSPEVEINLALTYAVRQDGYASALENANKRKRVFNKKVQAINFLPGDLVQRYDARWDETHSAARKLAP